MSLSVINYLTPAAFTDLYGGAPAVPFVHQVIQSADPDDMKARYDAAVAEIVALNALILAAFPDDSELQLSFNDASLAGGGDGHTFTLTLTWVPAIINELAVLSGIEEDDLIPDGASGLDSAFVLAASAQELAPRWRAMVDAAAASAAQPENGIIAPWQAHAGASQGTRFMAGLVWISNIQAEA